MGWRPALSLTKRSFAHTGSGQDGGGLLVVRVAGERAAVDRPFAPEGPALRASRRISFVMGAVAARFHDGTRARAGEAKRGCSVPPSAPSSASGIGRRPNSTYT